MTFSTVTNFITNQVYRVLTECKDSPLQTAMVAATSSLGLFALASAPKEEEEKTTLISGATMITLLSLHRHTRILGTACAIFCFVNTASFREKDTRDKIFLGLVPSSVILALTARAYLVKV